MIARLKKPAAYALRRLPRHFVPKVLSVRSNEFREGPPNGLDREHLYELGAQHLGVPVDTVSHQHLSNWKPTGAYRVSVRSKSRARWTVIYKDADYAFESVPAQLGLPIVLGQPEFHILSTHSGNLSEFLPEIYWVQHISGAQRYQYLMEDLSKRWYRPTSQRDVLAAAAAIPRFHEALRQSISVETREYLIRYDTSYSAALRKYVEASIGRYLKQCDLPIVAELWEEWPTVSSVHEEGAPPTFLANQPIHGDFNAWNLYLYWRRQGRLKAVDWEWAGVGVPHVDLASVLKHTSADVQRRALSSYALGDSRLSPQEHERVYHWCRMQDAIRDAGYVADQLLYLDYVPKGQSSFIVGCLKRAIQAAKALSA